MSSMSLSTFRAIVTDQDVEKHALEHAKLYESSKELLQRAHNLELQAAELRRDAHGTETRSWEEFDKAMEEAYLILREDASIAYDYAMEQRGCDL